ncbi:MAG: DEAD/DEAH box helicase family protein [Nitrosomonadales bacterium]|nr:DEAD/DEAH box helicase family protein [Nitrosomonadales bacterium]
MGFQYLYICLIVVSLGFSIYFYKELNKERRNNKENKQLLEKSFNFLNGYSQIQHNSENEFAKVVEKFDDPKWFVYRNVRWQWRKGGSVNNPMNEGEVDFLLVHKDLGVVLIEVKGGKGWRYNATKDIWTVKTPNGFEEAPGPYSQLSRNAMGLRNRIQYESNKLGFKNFRPRVNSFVVWANVNSDESKFGFIGYENNTIYADEFLNPQIIEDKIKKQFTLNDYKDDDLVLLFNKILNSNVKGFSLLSYSGKIAGKVEKISEDIFNTYYEITNEKYKKVKIQGIPGSGKTFIATKLAEHEEKHGRKVLFLCYNILLGEKLKTLFEDSTNITVLIFEEFINKLGVSYSDTVTINGETKPLKELSKIEEVKYIKQSLEDSIVDADEIFNFDTLIIDEAQDFYEGYWEFFTILVENKEAKWVICYDKNQGITHTNWKPPEYLNTPQIVLNTVIRSTKEIAKRYASLYDESIEHFGEIGIEPKLVLLEETNWKYIETKIEKILEDLSIESEELLLKTVLLLPHMKDVDNLSSKVIDTVSVSSVSRFKGLESDIIILVFPTLENLDRNYINDTLALLYVGLSRAKTNLYFLCGKDVQELANWKVI